MSIPIPPSVRHGMPYEPAYLFEAPMVEVTQSSISAYNDCEQKYVFRYLMRLVPAGVSIPLIVGATVHDCFEYLLSPVSEKDTESTKYEKTQKMIDGKFDSVINDPASMMYINTNQMEHARCQAKAVVAAWNIVNCDWRERFSVIRTEMSVRADPKAKAGDPLTKRAAGKIDGLVVTKDTEQLYVLEHKTRSTMKDFNFVDGLDLDQQVLFYAMLYQVWLERQPISIMDMSSKKKRKTSDLQLPSGFYYDAIMKPMHRTGDTSDEVIRRMVNAMIEDPAKYFVFIPVDVSQEIVEWAWENFKKTVHKMDNLKVGNVTRNLRACSMYGGCPYQMLCKAGADANDPVAVLKMPEAQLYQIGSLHNELTPDAGEEE